MAGNRSSTGIEHNSADSVLSAFGYYGLPNFAIFVGNDLRVAYDGGNQDEGRNSLQQWLAMIEANQTSTVYTLKVYPAQVTDIKSRTEHSGSTTFRLNEYGGAPGVRTDRDGNVIVLPQQQQIQAGGMNARLDKLESENRDLQKQLYNEQIKQVQLQFINQIAGLKEQLEKPTEKTVWERIGETLMEKPDIIEKLSTEAFSFLRHIIDTVSGKKENFVNNNKPPAPQINGTANTATMEQTVPVTDEGAYQHSYLTDDERKLKKSQRFDLMKQRLEKLTKEQIDDEQMACLEILEGRVGPVIITLLLLNVASMNDDDLNDVINHMR